MTRIAFVGAGNMARSLIGGLVRTGLPASSISASSPSAETRQLAGRAFGIATYADNGPCIEGADIVILATKPAVLPGLQPELSPLLRQQRPVVISVAAGAQLQQLGRWFGSTLPIIRCMPNTPALIGAGASVLCANAHTSAPQRAMAQQILDTCGLTRWVEDEALMDVVTALSGSGPAYFFALTEAMEQAAVALGLPAETARALAAQTCLGAGRMLAESSDSASVLRQRVTSPKGTTQAALDSFMADGLPSTVHRAMQAAAERSRQLALQLDEPTP
ncbi:pyrroline-5-carboxylate reductase [Frateuria aurantia]